MVLFTIARHDEVPWGLVSNTRCGGFTSLWYCLPLRFPWAKETRKWCVLV